MIERINFVREYGMYFQLSVSISCGTSSAESDGNKEEEGPEEDDEGDKADDEDEEIEAEVDGRKRFVNGCVAINVVWVAEVEEKEERGDAPVPDDGVKEDCDTLL